MKTNLFLIAAIAAGVVASSAPAANRTYCFEMVFKDDRNDCPTPSDPGAKRACHQEFHNFSSAPDGDYTHPVGHLVEVWDKDTTSDDDFIGTFILTSPTGGCATFAWEGASYQHGEANPDPYVIWKSEVRGTSGGPHVVARDMSNNRYGGVTWRAHALTDCQAGANCEQPGFLLVTTDSTTERGGRVMALDSSQHMLETYSSVLEDGDIDMRWPSAVSQTLDQHTYEVAGVKRDQAQSACHELGHVLQMQQLDRNSLRDDCSLNGPDHTLTVTEHESCATTEGWAGYVAAVSLWDPQNPLSAPSRFNFDYADPEPFMQTCSDNAGLEGQVVKAFWDLDDTDNEGPAGQATVADEVSLSTTSIAERWSIFPNGSGNREDQESDQDGVNMWDFHINNQAVWGDLDGTRHTLLGHNCLGTQDTN